MINLRLDDLKFDRVLVRGKGDKERIVPLNAAAAEALIAYFSEGRGQFLDAASSPFVFLGPRKGGKLSRMALWYIFAKRAKRVHWKHSLYPSPTGQSEAQCQLLRAETCPGPLS
jgi:site-specific recombinase XerD